MSEHGAEKDQCDAERCFCCGKGHFCEPDHYPTALGQTWTCPECGLVHEAFDVRANNRNRQWVRHIPEGTLGWRGVSSPAASVRAEVEAGEHPHALTCAWTVADEPCDCGVDDRLAARLYPSGKD